MSSHDFISEYLDSLPPDERRAQARSFEESALLRLAVERALELGPEDQKVLMAEFEVYAETGEVEEGSLFAGLLEDAEAIEWDEARSRSKAARGRSSLLRFLTRAGYEQSMRDFEEGFSQVDPLEQAFLKLTFDFAAEIGLLRQEAGRSSSTSSWRRGRMRCLSRTAADRLRPKRWSRSRSSVRSSGSKAK